VEFGVAFMRASDLCTHMESMQCWTFNNRKYDKHEIPTGGLPKQGLCATSLTYIAYSFLSVVYELNVRSHIWVTTERVRGTEVPIQVLAVAIVAGAVDEPNSQSATETIL
jgi:hypothetical protein